MRNKRGIHLGCVHVRLSLESCRLWRKLWRGRGQTVTVKVLIALLEIYLCVLTNDHMGARCHPDPSDGWVDGCSRSLIASWGSEKVAFHQESQHWLPAGVSQ